MTRPWQEVHVEQHVQVAARSCDVRVPCRIKHQVVPLTMPCVCCWLCVAANQHPKSAGGCTSGGSTRKWLTRVVSHMKEGCTSSILSLFLRKVLAKGCRTQQKKLASVRFAVFSLGPNGPQQKMLRYCNRQRSNPGPPASQMKALPTELLLLSSSC